MLQETFFALLQRYTNDLSLINRHWTFIAAQYTKRGRHYHTLHHLENMLLVLQPVMASLEDVDAVLLALYYHDVVYNARKNDNEERSAELAAEHLQTMNVPAGRCVQHILATKQHGENADSDTNYFTDADLCILGLPWTIYETYAKNVRKEYAIFPDLVYKPGRKKVLQHFLQMPRIFKTTYFADKYEIAAKSNLQRELATYG